jgi:heme exporter protein A
MRRIARVRDLRTYLADVAKLADAADLKSAFREEVRVRFPPSAPEKNEVLEVRQLHLWRGERHLLKGLGFTLAGGQALQLLWPNGTGKTSLLRCIAGFLHAEDGEILWQGERVSRDRDAFHRDLAYLGHQPALKGDLSAGENLRYSVGLRSRAAPERVDAALQIAGLAHLDPGQPVSSFSAGQQKRVALARLSLWGARLWLLDEPAANLDAAGQSVVVDFLQRHLAAGGAALIATHQGLELPGADLRNWSSPAVAA